VTRSYLSLTVVALVTARALNGDGGVLPSDLSVDSVWGSIIRLALFLIGVLAVGAMWQGRASARQLTGLWAALVLGLLVSQDVLVGFFRPGLAERLAATALFGLILGAVVWRARPSAAVVA
jgi:peptidoglycan/LPS O-acetylase OafA/YrhL